MNYVCEICGKSFESTCPTAKYCSRECNLQAFSNRHGGDLRAYRRSIYKRKTYEPIRCACCNKMFIPSRADAIYCSNRCRQHVENIRKRVKQNNARALHTDSRCRLQIQCNVCGKWFVPSSKDELTCKPCQIFQKYAKEHPELI